MLRSAILIRVVTFAFSIMLASCGNKSALLSQGPQGYGDLGISINLIKPSSLAKSAKTEATIWNKLITQITALDMDTIRDTTTITSSQLAIVKTISGIKAGENRKIEAWTINSTNNKIIHSSTPITTIIIENKTNNINITLNPVAGSIYFNFWEIDSRIDSVVVLFCTATDTLAACGGILSGSRIMLNIDYIPDNSHGTIKVFGIDYTAPLYDTLYVFSQDYLFKANTDSTLPVQFKSLPGSVNFNITFSLPGNTVVHGYMNGKQFLDSTELGPIYITEIMYAVNDSEYVEIHNPLSNEVVFDTLILEVNNTFRKFTNVTIKPDGYFVIGRKAMPFVDSYHPTTSALDLSSTGEFISLRNKDSSLIDCVFFTGSSNSEGWPVISSSQKASIVLDSLAGPEYNNHGENWVAATTPIPGTGLKGTPGAGNR